MTIRRLFHSTSLEFARKDYYHILKLNHHADKKTIKSHYYRLSKKYHPDLNPNNEEAHRMFLEINEAYAVLGNEANKRKYDNESTGQAHHFTRPGGGGNYAHAWQFKRRAPRNTGSASAKEQAERMGNKGPTFNHKEHYARHYESEELRRRLRLHQAAERRRAAGGGDETVRQKGENMWGRLWKLGIVLTAIGYATRFVV
ncbi:hypothetical protein G6F37_008288 [Rhizopus arrhizus]|jgi:DnaJ-class molecular chaperone|nr:hypothetical protein G6F38_012355 [Rhizopus arrhizus]KAG1155718.1 hypothetical protein G6F37_008288 [Rhizopus arrhizus]